MKKIYVSAKYTYIDAKSDLLFAIINIIQLIYFFNLKIFKPNTDSIQIDRICQIFS